MPVDASLSHVQSPCPYGPRTCSSLLRLIVDNLSDMVFVVGPDGQLIEVTGNCMGIAGYAREELLSLDGPRFLDTLLEPEDGAAVQQVIAGAASTLGSAALRVLLHDRAGEKRWCELALVPLRDDADRFVGVQGTFKDIGERVQAERIIGALNKASEAVQQAAMSTEGVLAAVTSELSGLGFYSVVLLDTGNAGEPLSASIAGDDVVVHAARRILSEARINWSITRIPALARCWALKETVPFVIDEPLIRHIVGRDDLIVPLARLLAPMRAVCAPLLADDRLIGALCVGAKAMDSGILPAVEVFANQTAIALRNSELVDRLAESERQYRSIFENARDGLLVVSKAGDVVAANPAASTLFRRPADNLLTMRLDQLLTADGNGGFQAISAEVQTRGHCDIEARGRRHDGDSFPIDLRASWLGFGGQAHMLVAVTDTTERLRAQEVLLSTERLRSLGQMAGGIAHDFNNILVGIRGYADMALTDMGEQPSLLKADLEQILLGTREATEAVRRLQALYRQPDDTSDFVPLPLDAVVAEAIALTRPRWRDALQATGVTIDVQVLSGNPAPVLGNASELKRVLTNLILNAIEAMPDGGTLTISTGGDGSTAWVTVRDSGVGMDATTQARIFDPFFSTKNSTGLGLTVTARIVQRHNGSITVCSAPGNGTEFRITLPAMRSADRQADSSQRTVDCALAAGSSVLVVDDEPVVRELLTRCLARLQHRVTAVGSGREALDLLASRRFDLVVTDLGMPGIPGTQVASGAHGLWPGIPIILATGWGETVTPDSLAAMHVGALLCKPFTQAELFAAIESATSAAHR